MQPIRSLLATLLLAACALPAAAQTIKTLGYNTTNGHVVYSNANPLRFTNEAVFGAATSDVVTVSDQGFSFSSTNTNTTSTVFTFEDSGADKLRQNARTNLGLGATWLTNTSVTNFRTAIGLGTGSDVTFNNVSANNDMFIANLAGNGDYAPVGVMDNGAITYVDPSTYRANLSLPLAALTNTSNVTMMRALAGSTNTNHPYSGSISVVGTNNTNTLVFSNGILQSVQ